MIESSYFAERLRQLRRAAGLSQLALAARCGVSVSAVRQFEQDLREPSFAVLVKIAKGLGLSLSAFDPPADPMSAPVDRSGPAVDAPPMPTPDYTRTTPAEGSRQGQLV